VQSYDWCNVL